MVMTLVLAEFVGGSRDGDTEWWPGSTREIHSPMRVRMDWATPLRNDQFQPPYRPAEVYRVDPTISFVVEIPYFGKTVEREAMDALAHRVTKAGKTTNFYFERVEWY